MGYDIQNAKEKPTLKADTIYDATIINIRDGIVKDFVTNQEKWKPEDLLSPAIYVDVEIMDNNTSFKFSHLFTYEQGDGHILYNKLSNLGKFKSKYNGLPVVAMQIKAITNNDGFAKIKLD